MTLEIGDRVVKINAEIDDFVPLGTEGVVKQAGHDMVGVIWNDQGGMELTYNGDKYPNTRLYWKKTFEPVSTISWEELELC